MLRRILVVSALPRDRDHSQSTPPVGLSLFDPLGFITRFTHGVGRLLLHKREAGKILISPKCCRKVAIITHSRKRQQGERSLVKYD